jgi:hypothetical protein
VEGASAGAETNHPHTDAIFPELNVAFLNLAAAAGGNNPPISEGQLLAARLEVVGVHDADGMSAALEGLGLRTPADLELLDDWAVAELDGIFGIGGFSAKSFAQSNGDAMTKSLRPRRAQAAETARKVEAEGGSGLSADTLALMSTAVLGIITFVLQARAAKNTEEAARELEHVRMEHERGRELAAIQLERVRSQMGDVYRPVHFMLIEAHYCAIYMQHELGFEHNKTWGLEFVRPFTLWPHLEVHTRDWSPKWLATFKGSPYEQYSPADIALLEDQAKRQLYIEAHTGCIAPRYREVAAILSTRSALMESPPGSYLDGVFPDGVTDWTKFSGGSLSFHMLDMAAFAHAWALLERRWEAGGMPALLHSSPLCNIVAHP